MHVWPLQEAKAKLSEVLKQCDQEPQIISLRGQERVIMMTMESYARIIQDKGTLVSFLAKSPLLGLDLELSRDASSNRNIEL